MGIPRTCFGDLYRECRLNSLWIRVAEVRVKFMVSIVCIWDHRQLGLGGSEWRVRRDPNFIVHFSYAEISWWWSWMCAWKDTAGSGIALSCLCCTPRVRITRRATCRENGSEFTMLKRNWRWCVREIWTGTVAKVEWCSCGDFFSSKNMTKRTFLFGLHF
jgi:hypothetical protein